MHDGKQDRNCVVDYERVMRRVSVFEGERCMQRCCHPHGVYCCISSLSLRENTAHYNVGAFELTSPGPSMCRDHFNWDYLNGSFLSPELVI